MPLKIADDTIETDEAGSKDPTTAETVPWRRARPAPTTEPEACACEACQGASRDEMWVRWA